MNQYKPDPKVAAGGIAGAIVALVLAGLAAYGVTLDDETGKALATLITAGLPVLAYFAAAWLKTDPAKELLKALQAAQSENDATQD